MAKKRFLLHLFCGFFVSVAQAWAEESDADEWAFFPTPCIWAVGLNGDATVKGVEGSIDASFIDIIDTADSIFAYNGRFEAVKGNWTIQLTPTFAKLGADDNDISNTAIEFDATVTLAIVELVGLYRLAEWPISQNQSLSQTLAFEPHVGGRYTNLRGELDFEGGPLGGIDVDRDRDWFDPFLGARLTLGLPDTVPCTRTTRTATAATSSNGI